MAQEAKRRRGLSLSTIVNSQIVIINCPLHHSLLSDESTQLGPAQLLLWQRIPDLQLTSRKPPGEQLVQTKHDKAIAASNDKMQNAMNMSETWNIKGTHTHKHTTHLALCRVIWPLVVPVLPLLWHAGLLVRQLSAPYMLE